MARLLTSGFEWKDTAGGTAAPDGSTNGSIEATIVRSGAASLKCVSTGGGGQTSTWSVSTVALGTNCFLRGYFYVPTAGLTNVAGLILQLLTGASTTLFGVQLNTDATLTLVSSAALIAQGSNSAAITLDAWNLIELRGQIGTGAVDQCEAMLGGVSFASASGLTVSDTQISQVAAGFSGSGATSTLYVDDVACNDSSGAAQNTWPGAGSVVLLRPTADSAVGTGWTLGNATATGGNAWQREDNIPPDSATDLTTTADATQIRNATSNANVNYDATMTTYTAAGVTGTVNVVVPQIATGAPVVTSAKAGTVGVVSNPTITNVSLGAGGTSGAFWSGVTIGTYPTGNKWSFGTTTYAPTVTLGTAPVMRVTQVTASTRIAIVTEMGIYVDYTPAVTTLPPPPVYVDSAVARSTSY